ncbi:MAG TPA: ROK family protein, partial [Chryseosolibacter sp.]
CMVGLNGIAIDRIGVGFGGPVNKETGEVYTSYHIEGWRAFSIRKWLEDLGGCEVVVDNDANVAALGETLYGAGKGYQRVLYVTLGSGVGAGLVIDRQIYHGAEPGEMEFGHIRLDRSGATIQDKCSGWAVNQKIREVLKQETSTVLRELSIPFAGHEAKALSEALSHNDPVAWKILSETMDDFSFGLSHAVHLLHPEVVILGGGLAMLGEIIIQEVKKSLPNYLMDAFRPGPLIQLSALQESAVPIGAIALAMQKN